MWEQPWRQADSLRRSFGVWLDAVGFGPREHPWTEVATSAACRLRRYDAAPRKQSAAAVLVVPAPIKRGYIWDLAPEASAVRRLLEGGLEVFQLDWREAPNAELGRFASDAIDWAVNVVARSSDRRVAIAGHSLGGTLAAIYAAARPKRTAALVLAEAPLAFGKDCGALAEAGKAVPRDGIAAGWGETVPGSALSLQGLLAAPDEFVLQRQVDRMLIIGDREAGALRMRVTRWLLDEFAMPTQLYREVVEELLRDDGFARGGLKIGGRTVDAGAIAAPVLAIVDPLSRLAPPAASHPVLKVPSRRSAMLRYRGDRGIGCRHVGSLVGPSAQRDIWPKAAAWLSQI